MSFGCCKGRGFIFWVLGDVSVGEKRESGWFVDGGWAGNLAEAGIGHMTPTAPLLIPIMLGEATVLTLSASIQSVAWNSRSGSIPSVVGGSQLSLWLVIWLQDGY